MLSFGIDTAPQLFCRSFIALPMICYSKSAQKSSVQMCEVASVLIDRILGAVVQLIEYQTCNQEVAGSTHTRSTASNIEQVANLLCAQANSASYPQRDRKWVVATATGWRPSVADWGHGVSASCSVTVGPVVR